MQNEPNWKLVRLESRDSSGSIAFVVVVGGVEVVGDAVVPWVAMELVVLASTLVLLLVVEVSLPCKVVLLLLTVVKLPSSVVPW